MVTVPFGATGVKPSIAIELSVTVAPNAAVPVFAGARTLVVPCSR
jgi:hypothetical protein